MTLPRRSFMLTLLSTPLAVAFPALAWAAIEPPTECVATVFVPDLDVGTEAVLHKVLEAQLMVMRSLYHELNDSITWAITQSRISELLNQLLSNHDLYRYAVVCDATTNTPGAVDQNRCISTVWVQPAFTDREYSFTVDSWGQLWMPDGCYHNLLDPAFNLRTILSEPTGNG